MNTKNFQDMLSLVEQPSRYLGSEVNIIKKDINSNIELYFALAFPDLYEIGTSHFGLQILYHILNSQKNIAAERVFTPAPDMEAQLREADILLSSLESGTPLNQFDIIGFSLLYELDFTNILTMLDLAGIPFLASQRDDSWPVIIAGGPCTCNPEPVADFFDAIVVGDGEQVIIKMSAAWMQWKAEPSNNKKDLLKLWSKIEGVYIPCFFDFKLNKDQASTLIPKFEAYKKVKRTIINDLDSSPFPDTPVIPFARPVHDRLRLEVARGCTRGCRFCQAGMIYRPVRERSPETLLSLTKAALESTGYEDLSLLSLSTGDYSCMELLMKQLMNRCASEHVAVSLPSLRAGTLTPELMELIKKVRKTGFTIAPEAGSQRLRDVINKNITHQDILNTVKDAFEAGWQVIKLYFMIGLPTETDEDIEAIVNLVKELKQIKGAKGRKAKLNVSVGTFIPKPHTPFQWQPQISLEESKQKINRLKDQLKIPGVHFKWQRPEVSFLEGIWARGDRRLSSLLITAYKQGCRFDGWSDKFQYDLWQKAFEYEAIDLDFYTTRTREMTDSLSWDHIDIGLTKTFLQNELTKAVNQKITQDCREGDCNICGVCDFNKIEPKIFNDHKIENYETKFNNNKPENFKTLEISYSKQGNGKYFGHLEMVNIFFRAIRRAKIPMKYSQGFHPMPKVSFNDPLPIGMESINEIFYMTVPDYVKVNNIKDDINKQLPQGLNINDCKIAPAKSKRSKPEFNNYKITIKSGIFDENALQSFKKCSKLILTRTNRKGQVKTIDLKEAVLKINLLSLQQLELRLKKGAQAGVRPAEVLKAIFSLSDKAVKTASIVKF